MKRIAIIGLGQIGGSMVLALRKRSKQYSITGIDPFSKRRRLLRSLLDRAGDQWQLANDADLTILCMHYDVVKEFLLQASKDRVLFDACSGKRKLVQIATSGKLRFVGGHPMTGSEFAGEKGWRPDLFEGAPFFLCPAKHALPADQKIVQAIVKDLGARSIIVDPVDHDRFVSISSHFPAILAGLLQEMGEIVPADFKGPGFHSMTRLANSSPELLQTFVKSNRKNVVKAAKEMRKLLKRWIETTDT
jgi:prephenate dehydrogenase